MALDLTTAANLLKKVYPDKYYDELVNKTRVTLSLLSKDESMVGQDREITFLNALDQNVNTSFSAALSAATSSASAWQRGQINGVTKHGVCLVDSGLIAAAATDVGSYLRPLKQAIDANLQNMLNRLGAEVLGSGWGDIGTIETGSISGATLRFLNASDMIKVEVGQNHVFSSAQSSAVLRASGATLTVSAVNRSTRTVTYSANVSTLSGVTDGDFVFNSGDRQNSATPNRICLSGMQAWIPPVGYNFSGDSFNGINRSVDPDRLAGQRLDQSGVSIEEAIQTGAMQVSAVGGMLSHMIVNPAIFNKLAIELGTRVRFEPAKEGILGFSSLAMNSAAGDVKIISDRFQPTASIMGVNLEDWELVSSGKIARINDSDGQTMLRDGSTDSVQVRLVSRFGQVVCKRPDRQINIAVTL